MSSHLFRAQFLHKAYSTEPSGTLFYENWRQSKTFFKKTHLKMYKNFVVPDKSSIPIPNPNLRKSTWYISQIVLNFAYSDLKYFRMNVDKWSYKGQMIIVKFESNPFWCSVQGILGALRWCHGCRCLGNIRSTAAAILIKGIIVKWSSTRMDVIGSTTDWVMLNAFIS